MRKLEATALVDRDGRLSLEVVTDLEPGEHRLTLLVDEKALAIQSPALFRHQFATFLEDWDNPEMSEYDAL